MRSYLILLCGLLIWAGPVGATTLQVTRIFQALSFHGADSDALPEGFARAVQADVMERPLVLQGALPEALVDAVMASTRLQVLPAAAPYEVEEVNLARLCQIGHRTKYRENRFSITLDLKRFSVPEELELSEEQVLRLLVQAMEKTLKLYGAGQAVETEVEIVIFGTKQKNARLVDLEKQFLIGG